MALDINKCVKAATIPIIALVVLGVIGQFTGMVPLFGIIVGMVLFLASLMVLAWAGFMAVKQHGTDLVGGAVTGAVAGVVSGVINGVIGIVLFFLGIGATAAAMTSMGAAGVAIAGTAMIVGLVIGLITGTIFSAIVGAVFGAVGAFVAQKK